MFKNIRWLRWSWLILTFLFLLLRFQNLQGVMTPFGVIFNDTDPYYRLHRIETMLHEQKFYPLHDSSLSYPAGVDVPWPTGLDILIAFPLQVYNSFQQIEIESFSAIVIPFFSLPLLWCAGWIGTHLAGPLVGLLLGILVTFSPTLAYQTGIGRLDHHFLEALFPIALLMFLLKFRNRRNNYNKSWIIFILGLAPSFAPQGWILGPFLTLALLFERDQEDLRTFSKIFFFSFLVSLVPLSFSDRFFQGYFSWVSFSWWSPWMYICCSFFLECVALFNKKRKIEWPYQALLTVSFFSVLAFLFLNNHADFIQSNISSALGAVNAKHGTMASTMETRSLFSLPGDFWKHSDFHILVISVVCFAFFLLRRQHLFLLGYCLIPLVLSFYQIRFVTFGISLMILLALIFFHELIRKLNIRRLHQNLILLGVAALMFIPFRPTLSFFRIPNMHRYFEPVRQFSFFLNKEYKAHHWTKGNQAILAHWDYGHWLLYYTGLPVVADPFQGPSAFEVLQLFTSRGTDEFDEFLLKHPSKYLLIESGALRSYRWIETVGKDPGIYFKKVNESTSNEYFQTTEAFDELFMFRYFFELGRGLDDNQPQHWRLIYISPFPSPMDTDIPALKVFENVTGAQIRVHTTKKYKELYLMADVVEKGDPTIFKQKATGTQIFEWTVPYGTYDKGDVVFSGDYIIRDEKGKILGHVPRISEEQVLQGDKIDVRL